MRTAGDLQRPRSAELADQLAAALTRVTAAPPAARSRARARPRARSAPSTAHAAPGASRRRPGRGAAAASRARRTSRRPGWAGRGQVRLARAVPVGRHPVVLPLEGIAGQPHRAMVSRLVERGPVGRRTRAPQLAQAAQHEFAVVTLLLRMPEGAGDGPVAGPARCWRANVPRVWPGPPRAARDPGPRSSSPRQPEKRTVWRSCTPQYSGLVACSSVIHVPVTFEQNGMRGGLSVAARTSSMNGPTAAAMLGEWNACEVCSRWQRHARGGEPLAQVPDGLGADPTTTLLAASWPRRGTGARPVVFAEPAGSSGSGSRPPAWRRAASPGRGGRARPPAGPRPAGRTRRPGRRRCTRRCCGRPWRAGRIPQEHQSRASAYSTMNSTGWVTAVSASARAAASRLGGRREQHGRRSVPSRPANSSAHWSSPR